MTEHFGSPSHPREDPAADARTNGAVTPTSSGLLDGMISDILRKRWIEVEPGEGCFDRDETRMGLLLSFIGGEATPEECDSVRGHLLECPRCRFIYARLRETPGAEDEPVVAERHGAAGHREFRGSSQSRRGFPGRPWIKGWGDGVPEPAGCQRSEGHAMGDSDEVRRAIETLTVTIPKLREEAADVIVKSYWQKLVRYAQDRLRRMTHREVNEASVEDAVLQVLFEVVRQLEVGLKRDGTPIRLAGVQDPERELEKWLRCRVRHRLKNQVGEEVREKAKRNGPPGPRWPQWKESVERKELVEHLLNRLSHPIHRRAAKLMMSGWSHARIAEALGLTPRRMEGVSCKIREAWAEEFPDQKPRPGPRGGRDADELSAADAEAQLDDTRPFLEDIFGPCPADVTTRPAPGPQLPDLVPRQLLGDYELLKEVGRGGHSVVWKALNFVTGRVVALKVIVPEGDREAAIRRLRKEAGTVAALDDDDHYLTALDWGEAEGFHFFAMRFIEGSRSLARVLEEYKAQGRRMPADQAVVIIIAVASALASAHRRGIVHRDLKPSNILMTPDGRIFVIDLGAAKHLIEPGPEGAPMAESSAEPGRAARKGFDPGGTRGFIGTPRYASPEQFRDAGCVDERSDIYGLAVMLYEMVTGQLPFDGPTFGEIRDKVQTEEPVPPRKLNRAIAEGVRPWLQTIILRGLAKTPEERFRSAHHLALALEHGFIRASAITLAGYLSADADSHPIHSWQMRILSRLQKLGIGHHSAIKVLDFWLRTICRLAGVDWLVPAVGRVQQWMDAR